MIDCEICGGRHRTYRNVAKCHFPHAHWIHGHGQYACVSRCRGYTVTLWDTREEAEAAKKEIDDFACGGACSRWHDVVDLDAVNA